MNRLFFVFPFVSFASLVACSSDPSSEGAASSPEQVFAVAKTDAADASEVTGVWEVAEPTRAGNLESRIRFELRADHVVAAARCTTTDDSAEPVVAGARVSGSATSSAISVGQRIEATKPIGPGGVCGVRVAQGALPRCAEGDVEKRKGCFSIEDGTLTLYQASGPVAFTKIAD